MASDISAPKVATPSTPKALVQQSTSTPASLFLVLAVGLLWAHLAVAEHFGKFQLVRSLGEPASSLVKYLLCSFVLYIVKPPVIEWFCRAAGFDLLTTINVRWSSDNLHLLSTGLGVWAIAYSILDPVGGSWGSLLVVEVCFGFFFAIYLNISKYGTPSPTPAQPQRLT
jgi:hypothetical protein